MDFNEAAKSRILTFKEYRQLKKVQKESKKYKDVDLTVLMNLGDTLINMNHYLLIEIKDDFINIEGENIDIKKEMEINRRYRDRIDDIIKRQSVPLNIIDKVKKHTGEK